MNGGGDGMCIEVCGVGSIGRNSDGDALRCVVLGALVGIATVMH